MDQGTFDAMQAQIGAVDFEGATGRLRFKDQGDPLGLPGPDPDLFLQEIMQRTGEGLERVGLADKSGTTWSVTELKFAGFGGSEEFSFASPAPLAQFQTCLGQELDFAENTCVACPPGAESTEQGCTSCRPGFFAAGVAGAGGLTACSACAPGTFTAAFGSASCTPCAAGKVADRPGMQACSACEAGTFANADSTECTRCAVASFQEKAGQTECSPCPAQHTTVYEGAEDASACVCDRGLVTTAGGACVECLDGLDCPGFGEKPIVKFGYFGVEVNDSIADISVYKCLFPTPGICLGGANGLCTEGRTGLVCGKCKVGYYIAGDLCKECQGSIAQVLFCFVIAIGYVSIYVMYHVTNQRKNRRTNTVILVMILGGLVPGCKEARGRTGAGSPGCVE